MAVYRNVNVNGIPCIESTGVVLTAESATFSFAPHPSGRGDRFAGLIAVKIRPQDVFTAPSTAVPIRFTTTGASGSDITVTGYNGTVVTTTEWTGTGIYLLFFDPDTNQLHLIS